MHTTSERTLEDFEKQLSLTNLEIRRSLSNINKLISKMTDQSSQWPAAKIRSTFIDFFVKKKNHTFWSSSPVVPLNDPTLLFINAGMNQFKPLFLGTCDPSLEMSKLKMAVNSQKCIRAGGKHNDLEDVGKDVYHHTFFEMLGNWSFGTYFKEEAITWAWECLTEEFKLDSSRIYATYFGGDEASGLAPDLEARDIWKRFLPEERVLPFGCKENFWEMGATGPCGPCTEIHYDRIGGRDAASLVNADRPDVIEIWNNVFIQFNRENDGSLKELPNKHVDTGMGFERLASILQGKDSNYDTDIFAPIFSAIQSITNCRPYCGKLGPEDEGLVDMAYRVVADHIRTLVFAITDGAVPSNDGRGYVLRRILRRAVRYGQEMLGAPNGFFAKLVPVVADNFSDAFPELKARQEYVMMVITDEEQSFTKTLDQGVKHFKKVVAALEISKQTVIPAKDAHILFSSMGFPLDLTELMAAEIGFSVDRKGFESLMENDRKISEAAEQLRKGISTKDLSMEAEQTSWLQNNGIDHTNADHKYVWDSEIVSEVKAIYFGKGGQDAGFIQEASTTDGLVGLVLDRTSFYYESGGQIYDTGYLETENGSIKFSIVDVQTYAGYVVHVGTVETEGKLLLKDKVVLHVDYSRRSFVAPNHTMTHVLNYALRKVLITNNSDSNFVGYNLCEQKGSFVDSEKLRFDFSWTGPLTSSQLAEVEKIVNDKIHSKQFVYTEVVPLAKASEIVSLRKVFGETYPDPVRVVSVGVPINDLLQNPSNNEWVNYSLEFCGGTHLTNTIQAENFVIIEESGIAKGIRRIVGLTRNQALAAKTRAEDIYSKMKYLESLSGGQELVSKHKALKLEVDQAVISLVAKDELRKRLTSVFETIRVYNKANEALKLSNSLSKIDSIVSKAKEANSEIIVCSLDFGGDGKIAKKLTEKIKELFPLGSYFLITPDEEFEKVVFFAGASSVHVSKGLNAKEWVEFCINQSGSVGRGGGKSDQANGSVTSCPEFKIIDSATKFAQSKSLLVLNEF